MFSLAQQIPGVHTRTGHVAYRGVQLAQPKTRSERHLSLRQAQLRWLDSVSVQSGLTLTQVARRSGLAPSTLTRFRSDEERDGTLATLTMSTISIEMGIPIPPDALGDTGAPGFREPEATPYQGDPEDPLEAPIGAFIAGRRGVDAWVLRSRALEYEGYRPGDVLIVDLNATPRPGDVVCAQLYDWQKGGAETVFRLHQPPILLGAGPVEEARRPHFIDGRNVVVKGVVVTSFRGRAAKAA